jgi:hypothetical protein
MVISMAKYAAALAIVFFFYTMIDNTSAMNQCLVNNSYDACVYTIR